MFLKKAIPIIHKEKVSGLLHGLKRAMVQRQVNDGYRLIGNPATKLQNHRKISRCSFKGTHCTKADAKMGLVGNEI